MGEFNIQKIFFGLKMPSLFMRKPAGVENSRLEGFLNEMNTGLFGAKQEQNHPLQRLQPAVFQNTSAMNSMAQADRSVYIKNLLNLPQSLGQILQNAQNLSKPLAGGTLGINTINAEFLTSQKVLSEIFQEMDETLNLQNPAVLNPAQSQAKPEAAVLMFSGMISMSEISKLILQHSKQAVAALVVSMASAAKNGMDGKQIQETLSVINSCIAMAESDNPAQNLKSLMMLYLPWLPLNEGVGFDLEISPPEGENESNDSKLTVLIQTKNYGNLKGVFTLTTSNSVDIYIICSDKFPKEELQKSLNSESTSHAMNTNIDIEEVKPAVDELNASRETKVNLSATNEMNPYLLLMAHAFIRYTILIDNGGEV